MGSKLSSFVLTLRESDNSSPQTGKPSIGMYAKLNRQVHNLLLRSVRFYKVSAFKILVILEESLDENFISMSVLNVHKGAG